jgi:hypothetical protein
MEPGYLIWYRDGLRAALSGFDSRQKQVVFLCYTAAIADIYTGYHGAIPPGIKRPGCEADHSPSSSAMVKNRGAIPSLPHTSSWCST